MNKDKIKAEDYPHHVECLGSVEEFKNYIVLFIEHAPEGYTIEDIKRILDDEEKAKLSPSMWSAPWQL